MEYDLHVHTTASDGLLTTDQVIARASQSGLKGLAITDHDTVAGIPSPASERIVLKSGVVIIHGIEINTDFHNEEVHILGYYINAGNKALLDRLAEVKQLRQQRASQIVNSLNDMGFAIDMQRVQQLAGDSIIGRPHIARAMIEKGIVGTVEEAFNLYIGRGCPAYVPRYHLLPDEAIILINNAGGVPVLAHPGLIHQSGIIEQILNMGIAGIEVFYPEHTPKQVRDLLNLARERALLITGGSDFHGMGKTRNKLGGAGLNYNLFSTFVEKAWRYRQNR